MIQILDLIHFSIGPTSAVETFLICARMVHIMLDSPVQNLGVLECVFNLRCQHHRNQHNTSVIRTSAKRAQPDTLAFLNYALATQHQYTPTQIYDKSTTNLRQIYDKSTKLLNLLHIYHTSTTNLPQIYHKSTTTSSSSNLSASKKFCLMIAPFMVEVPR